MKIALSQFNMRLGDLDGIRDRLESQIRLAADRGASLFCSPAPLFAGVLPGCLLDYSNYESSLLSCLEMLAASIEGLGITCLIPAPIMVEGGPLFEIFMINEGRVVPSRLSCMYKRREIGVELWDPPVFDHEGVRVALTFDINRDIELLPPGCDLVINFQVNGFDSSNAASAAVASVMEGCYSEIAVRKGVWVAFMAPVGGFDESVFTGGSFLMTDAGRVVDYCRCFEEDLLVCDVERGSTPDGRHSALPQFQREEWMWGALRLHLLDSIRASSKSRALVVLSGDLQSSLLAVLAADALGSRNVIGVLIDRDDSCTAHQEALYQKQLARARDVADALHIQVVELSVSDFLIAPLVSGAAASQGLMHIDIFDSCLSTLADNYGGKLLSSLTKTDYALAANAQKTDFAALLAPFGDVYLSELEYLARYRNSRSEVIPSELFAPCELEGIKERLLMAAINNLPSEYVSDAALTLENISLMEIDRALESHVEKNQSFEENQLSLKKPASLSLLLLLVRNGELVRRRLPVYPIVSSRSFVERVWPYQLAWSDAGNDGRDRSSVEEYAKRELDRMSDKAGERGARVREEIMDMLGDLMGFDMDELARMMSPENQARMREEIQQVDPRAFEMLRKAMQAGVDADQGIPGVGLAGRFFFSLN